MFFAVAVVFFVHQWEVERPAVSYLDVSSGDGKPDVLYKFGQPTYVYNDISSAQTKTMGIGPWSEYQNDPRIYSVVGDPAKDQNALPANKKIDDFDAWTFASLEAAGGGAVTINFTQHGKVRRVECLSLNLQRGACKPVLGIDIAEREADLKSRLGLPGYSETANDIRFIGYPRQRVSFILQKERVYSINVGEMQHFGGQ